ncbi:hypothetical protein LJR080_000332 [Mycolicibacterium frederiksbergense]
MKDVLNDIVDGTFATRFIGDQDRGVTEFASLRKQCESHPIEARGANCVD